MHIIRIRLKWFQTGKVLNMPKEKKISVRVDSIRSFKIAKYQTENKIKGKKMTTTQFITKAMDELIEKDTVQEEILFYENILLETIGIRKSDYEDRQDYLNVLQHKVKVLKKVLDNFKLGR